MSVIYITEHDAKIGINENRLVIETKDLKRYIPIKKVEALLLIGKITPSASILMYLLKEGIPVTWLSSKGEFFGRLDNTSKVNIERQRNQFRRGDEEEFCLEISKKFITGKISNQLVLLRRYNRDRQISEVKEYIQGISHLKYEIDKVSSIERLIGYEGLAARYYFRAISLFVANKEFKFSGRNKQPPRDPFNSLLSFGYTLMMYEVYTAIELRGLNPYAGFLHQDKLKHPALASDLMEEWRPVIVDSLVLSLLNGGSFNAADFEKADNGGVYLSREASKKFIQRFEKRIQRRHMYIENGFTSSFRHTVLSQVTSLLEALSHNNPDLYKPILIR